MHLPLVVLIRLLLFLCLHLAGLCRGEVPRRGGSVGFKLHGSIPVHKVCAQDALANSSRCLSPACLETA